MHQPPWEKLGSLYVTAEQAKAAQRGESVRVFPEGMETLATFPSLVSAPSGPGVMRRRESYVGVMPEAGIVDTDSNPVLPPRVWRGDTGSIGICDQMLKEDPVAKAIKLSWALPIIRSAWSVEPNGEDRPALEMAEFVRANFWEYLRGGWQTFIEQAVGCLHRGFSLFEIVVAFDRDLQKVRLDQLSPMLPRTVYEWGRYKDGRWGVTQLPYVGDPNVGTNSPAQGDYVNLSPDKILHFAFDPDGDAPEGTSILRPCYGAWKQRRLYLKLEAAGYERGAFGIPYVQLDSAARIGDSEVVNTILRELRTGSRAWATLPPGYTLQFADFPMKGADIREARVAAGRDMARAGLAHFLYTGESSGAYSLVRGHQDFFQMALQGAADMIAGVLSQGPHSIVKRLCLWNYNNVKSTPVIAPGSISIGDPEKLVYAIKSAAEAQALTPDIGIEEAVRTALGLPEMPEETVEQWKHRIRNVNPAELITGDDEEPALAPSDAAHDADPDAPDVTDEQKDRVEGEAEGIEKLSEFYGAPEAARNGRPLRPMETVVRLDETLAPMLGVKESMAKIVKEWRDTISGEYAAKVARGGDLVKMRRVEVPGIGPLVEALKAELRRAYRAGQDAVENELERTARSPEVAQAIADGSFAVTRDEVVVDLPDETEVLSAQMRFSFTGRPLTGLSYIFSLQAREHELLAAGMPSPPAKVRKVKAKKPKGAGTSVTDEVDPEKVIDDIARSTGLAAADRVRDEAVRAAQAASTGGVLDAAAAQQAIQTAIDVLAISKDMSNAQRDTNTVFGLGRIQEARAEDAEWGVYSTMLESATCEVCASYDGTEFRMEQIDQYATPNPDCEGGDQCNCIILWLPKTEE